MAETAVPISSVQEITVHDGRTDTRVASMPKTEALKTAHQRERMGKNMRDFLGKKIHEVENGGRPNGEWI